MNSEQLTSLFHELNQRYFNGELPEYRVVAHKPLMSRLGLHNGAKREIQVDCTLEGDDAVAVLLHELIHAKVGDHHQHDKTFNAEAERVERLSGLNLRQYRQDDAERDLLHKAAVMEYEAFIYNIQSRGWQSYDAQTLNRLKRNRHITKDEHKAYMERINEKIQ